MKNQILIVSSSDDAHADDVEAELGRRGERFRRFDVGVFPGGAELVYEIGGNVRGRRCLRDEQGSIDLDDVKSVWYRRPNRVGSFSRRKLTDYARAETVDNVYAALTAIDCLHLPGPRWTLDRGELKILQLRAAEKLGFQLPPTQITNSPAEFITFFNDQPKVISKVGQSAAFQLTHPEFARYTEVVTRRDLAFAATIAECPVLFQGYVPKQLELRITVVGEQLFAVEIDSQASAHATTDWRRYDPSTTPYRRHELPRRVAERCLALTRALGLQYGAIDLILSPSGEYVFLEINPSGQYGWIESLTGLPITAAICDLLAAGGVVAPQQLAAAG
jgi:glutathione synthase/RimK-type ligase-like ATP-grasp enzyme